MRRGPASPVYRSTLTPAYPTRSCPTRSCPAWLDGAWRRRVGLPLALLTALLPFHGPAAQASPASSAEQILGEIEAATLDVGNARTVGGLRLDTGFVRLRLQEGLLFPVATASGQVAEMIFVGRGRVQVTPPDEIEAGQLELFTQSSTVDQGFDEAVLVIGSDLARDALLGRPIAPDPEPTLVERARDRLAAWRTSRERELLETDVGLAADLLGDPLYDSFFTAWFRCDELKEVILSVQPDSEEQVTLGRFEPLEAEAKEERKLRKAIGKAQRRGRLLGLELDDLGVWDTWMSVPLYELDEKRPGQAAFQPVHYGLDMEAEPRDFGLRGTARLRLRASYEGARVVHVGLHRDLELDSIVDGEGQPLHHVRSGASVRVFLRQPAPEVELEIAFHGRFFDKGERKVWALRDNYFWHPRTYDLAPATYDLRLRWPERLDLLAAGRVVEEGTEGGRSWRRLALDRPEAGIAFTLGNYDLETRRVGEVEVVVGIDKGLEAIDGDATREIVDAAASSLAYFGEIYGPYPYDRLVVATAPTSVSQAMPGFVVLSDVMMLGSGGLAVLLGLEDRRSVVAHEIAHQWWGHSVRWDGYRDQWISEAMASYSALLWARNGNEGDPVPLVLRPTSGWRRDLGARLANGRSIESLGPLVLGLRLSSSLTDAAYSTIVYRKGAVVLDMLSRHWGESDFVKILGAITRSAAGHSLSTAELFDLIEQASGKNFDTFAERFVYGTGLVDVYYDYRIEKADDGWAVHLEAEQQVPYRLVYGIEEEDGRLDVVRRSVTQIDDDAVELVVPVRLPLADGGKKRKKNASQRVVNGRLVLDQQQNTITLPLQVQPESLELDPDSEVFGRFWNRREEPKRVAYFEGYDQEAAGDLEQARATYLRVLATATPPDPRDDREERKNKEDEDRLLDGRAHLRLARLDLDAGALDAAEARLEQARRAVRRDDRWRIDPVADLLAARIDLRRGNAEDAFRALRKQVLVKERLGGSEAWLVLAIAAHETGHAEELEEALEAARQREADLGPLAELARSSGE